jgi:hypothetical protein
MRSLNKSSSNWSCFSNTPYYYNTEIKDDKLVRIESYLGNAYKDLFKVSEGRMLLEKL